MIQIQNTNDFLFFAQINTSCTSENKVLHLENSHSLPFISFFSLGKCWVEKIGKRRAEPDHISRLIRHRHTFLFIHKRIVGFSFFLHCANRNYSGFRDIPTRVAQTFSKKQLDAFYPPPPLLISWLHCIRRGKIWVGRWFHCFVLASSAIEMGKRFTESQLQCK